MDAVHPCFVSSLSQGQVKYARTSLLELESDLSGVGFFNVSIGVAAAKLGAIGESHFKFATLSVLARPSVNSPSSFVNNFGFVDAKKLGDTDISRLKTDPVVGHATDQELLHLLSIFVLRHATD